MTQRSFLVIILLFLYNFSNAQSPVPGIEWQRIFPFSYYGYSNIKQTHDGGYAFCGALNTQGSFVKLTGTGYIEWQVNFEGDYIFTQVLQTGDGGYIIAGTIITQVYPVEYSDWLIIKLSSTGVTEWRKTFGGSGPFERAVSIDQTLDGGYIVAGTATSPDGDVTGWHQDNASTEDYWILRLNSSGDIVWQKCLGGTGQDLVHSVRATADGGYIVSGNAGSTDGDVIGNHGDWDVWILKLDGTGDIQWQKCLGGNNTSIGHSIWQTSDSGYIIAASTTANDGDVSGHHGDWDVWIIKLNGTGNLQWQKCLGGTRMEMSRSIQQTIDGGYIIAGETESSNGDVSGYHQMRDSWIIKTDSSAVIEWQKCFGGSDNDWSWNIQQTADGGYIFINTTSSHDGDVPATGGAGAPWVVKMGNDPLPLSLNNFTAYRQNKKATLHWQTSSEINLKDFVIQRSKNGHDFESIGTVATTGNLSSLKNYSYTDIAPGEGMNYYRLKQVNHDGSFVYSKIVAVDFAGNATVIYPNPAGNVIHVKSREKIKGIILLDAAGKNVLHIKPNAANRYNVSALPQGIYSVQLLLENSQEVIQLNKL